MKVTLLIPTLNEIEGMRTIMPRVQKSWYDQLIVLDGGSTDGTIEYAREQGYFVYVQKQRGIRRGYLEVLPFVEGDVLIPFSPDGNSLPEVIPELASKMREGYDMVVASRYLGAAKSEDDDRLTGFGNWFFTKTVNVLLGGDLTDTMVMFRAFKTRLIKDLGLDHEAEFALPERIFGCPGEVDWIPLLSARAQRLGLRVTEIPADEPPRMGGVRKLKVFRWGGVVYFQFLREFLKRWKSSDKTKEVPSA